MVIQLVRRPAVSMRGALQQIPAPWKSLDDFSGGLLCCAIAHESARLSA